MTTDLSIEIELVPAFYDLDPMDIVWHGNYVKYLEVARSALLAKFNYDYPAMRASGFAWPIVDLRLKYIRPALYGKPMLVRAEITEWEHRLRIDYLIRDASTKANMTKAHSIQVAIDMATQEMCFVSPAILLQRLGVRLP
jgi:acyl-CoA thioester hydrolase